MLNYRVLYKMPEFGLPFYGKKEGADYYKSYEVREYAPCKRTISINDKHYFLPFPYMIFLSYSSYSSSTFYTWFTTKKFDGDLQQKLYVPFLPNIDYQGRVCLGGGGSMYPTPIENLICAFWSRNFSSYASHHCTGDSVTLLRLITKNTRDSSPRDWINVCLATWASLSTKQLTARLVNRKACMKFSRLVSDWGVNL